MKSIENLLKKLVSFQNNNKHIFALVVVFFTIFMMFGVTKLEVETDLSAQMPGQLPIYQLNDKITDKYGGQDTVLVLFELDDTYDTKETPRDIRDVSMIKYLIGLEESLLKESSIEAVTSPGTFLKSFPLNNNDDVISALDIVKPAQQFISDDNKYVMMIIRADVGGGQQKIVALTELIDDKIASLSVPAGIKSIVTGSPSMQVTMLDLLISDSMFTIVIASILIFFLLLITERSLSKSIVIFMPLMLGLVWTMGILGWLGIKISVATAGLGAMILGLGVEYGVFMYTRYHEERQHDKTQIEALQIAVPAVGSALIGSGSTTIVGFLALTLSIMPMLQSLGMSLAIGIASCLLAAIVVEPLIIILEEDLEHHLVHKMSHKYETKKIHVARKKR